MLALCAFCFGDTPVVADSSLPAPGGQYRATRLKDGDALDLNERVLGEAGDFDRAARRIVTGKERGVNAVHGSEVVHVAQENGGFDDVFHGCAGSLEDGLAVFERLAGLLLDRGGESTGGHVNGKLAGRDDQAARPDALRIRADRRGGLFGCDNVFQFWFSPPWCENSLSSLQNAVNINHKSFQSLNIFLFIAHKF